MRKNDSFTYFNLLILCIWPKVINKVKVTHQGQGHIKVKVKYLRPFKFYVAHTICKWVVCIGLKCYLLSLGSDLQMGLDVEQMDNEILQSIAPGNIPPDPTLMVSKINSDDTEILDEQAALDEEDNREPTKSEADNKLWKRKGQLVVQSFQLAQN